MKLYFNNMYYIHSLRASQVELMGKNPPANAEKWDVSSIPGLGRFPGGGSRNLLQHSCLDNPMDRGAWRAMVQRVTKSWTQLKWLSMPAHSLNIFLKPWQDNPYVCVFVCMCVYVCVRERWYILAFSWWACRWACDVEKVRSPRQGGEVDGRNRSNPRLRKLI